MKRFILSIFFVLCFCCGFMLTAAADLDVTSQDISQLAEENGRALIGIPRPAQGANVYMAHVEFGHIDNPVLLISNDLTDNDAIVEVRAHNFQQGLFKRHMIRIHPGQEFSLDMQSLKGEYNVLQFCSLEPFTAVIKNQADQVCTPVMRKDLVYNNRISPEDEEEMKELANSMVPSRALTTGECVGLWYLECMDPSTCGSYSVLKPGYISVNGSCRMVYWSSHTPVSCGTIMSTTVSSSGCYAYWWHYGDCPWYVTNCNGEMYSVDIY